MATFPCAEKSLCLDPSTPFANLSAELPDMEIFIGRNTGFGPAYPPLGSLFLAVGCTSFCESTVSQQDADQCAANGNIGCLSAAWPTSSPGFDVFGNPIAIPRNRSIFRNRAQTATVSCPDGNPFVYTVPAGKYSAFSQAQADATAQADAQQNAPNFLVCIGDLAHTQICAGVPYNDSVTASGNFLTDGNTCWDIIGSLPPGIMSDLNFTSECFTGSRTLHLFGTPTIPGTYQFGIQVEDGRGDFMVKTVTLRVVGITGVNPMPNGSVGMAYQQFLMPVAVTNPIYSIDGGTLPPGLSLDATGVIFGTPTTGGTFNFVLGVTEAGTGLTCESAASIKIADAGIHFNNLVWSPPNLFGTSASNAGGNHGNSSASDATDFGASGASQQGTFNYTGPMANCNLQITIVFGFSATSSMSGGADIFQDGVLIATINKSDNAGTGPDVSGTYNLPFTVAAGVNSVIVVDFDCSCSANNMNNGCSISVSMIVTPA